MNLIIVKAANINYADKQNRTALFFAGFFSNAGALKALLEHADYQENVTVTFEGLSWKERGFLLKKMEYVKTVAFLFAVKTKLEKIIETQQPTPVLAALFALKDLAEFERQVKAFGDINQEIFANGQTLLSYACYKGLAPEKIQILLQMPGIKVNYKDKQGYSALTLAFSERSWETIKLLLSMPGIDCSGITSQISPKGLTPFGNIDWNYRAKTDHSTPLMWICKIPCETEQEKKEKSRLAIDLMQKTPVNIKLRDNMGRTALFYAAESNSQEIVKSLIAKDKNNVEFSFNGLSERDYDLLRQKLASICQRLMAVYDPVGDSLNEVLMKLRLKQQPEMLPMFANNKERSRSPSPETKKKILGGLPEMSQTS